MLHPVQQNDVLIFALCNFILPSHFISSYFTFCPNVIHWRFSKTSALYASSRYYQHELGELRVYKLFHLQSQLLPCLRHTLQWRRAVFSILCRPHVMSWLFRRREEWIVFRVSVLWKMLQLFIRLISCRLHGLWLLIRSRCMSELFLVHEPTESVILHIEWAATERTIWREASVSAQDEFAAGTAWHAWKSQKESTAAGDVSEELRELRGVELEKLEESSVLF